jgi:hydroxymethylbilane synthase
MTHTAEAALRVGTRGSRLALWQAERVAAGLRAIDRRRPVVLVPIASAGDHHHDTAVADLGVIGIFTREIELALLEQRIDVAVHSLKDLPVVAPPGLIIAALLPRDDPRDALVAPGLAPAAADLALLPRGARVATSSLRRQAEVLRHRPDCRVVELRGNVPTRIDRALRGEVDAIVVSQAGLVRLDLTPPGHAVLPPALMLPAPAQGTIAVQVRDDDVAVHAWVAQLDDAPTRRCTTAERTVMALLRGGCRVPLGVLAQEQAETLTIQARLCSPDGTRMVEASIGGAATRDGSLAQQVAAALRAQGADAILAALERL